MSLLSIIIVNWNTCDLLARCLGSLSQPPSSGDFEIWVVDNASTDGSLEMLRRDFPQVKLILNQTNAGFARANNQALAQSQSQYSLLLNSDAFPEPGSIQAMLKLMEEHPRAGLVGARLLNPDGTFQTGFTPFPNLGQEFLVLSGLGRLFLGSWYPSQAAQALVCWCGGPPSSKWGAWMKPTSCMPKRWIGVTPCAKKAGRSGINRLPKQYISVGAAVKIAPCNARPIYIAAVFAFSVNTMAPLQPRPLSGYCMDLQP
jgi:hypothetical protein